MNGQPIRKNYFNDKFDFLTFFLYLCIGVKKS